MRSDLRGRRMEAAGEAVTEPYERWGEARPSDARNVIGRDWDEPWASGLERTLPLAQGGYYLATGVWPLLHMDSFERVTGRKHDKWLVRTVGALAAAIGTGLLLSARRGGMRAEMRTVATLAAAGFTLVEVPTVLRGRISPVYLADTALEVGFLAAHALAANRRRDPAYELDRRVAEEAREGHWDLDDGLS